MPLWQPSYNAVRPAQDCRLNLIVNLLVVNLLGRAAARTAVNAGPDSADGAVPVFAPGAKAEEPSDEEPFLRVRPDQSATGRRATAGGHARRHRGNPQSLSRRPLSRRPASRRAARLAPKAPDRPGHDPHEGCAVRTGYCITGAARDGCNARPRRAPARQASAALGRGLRRSGLADGVDRRGMKHA